MAMKSKATKNQSTELIKIHVFPESKAEKVTKKDQNTLILHIREPAEDNKANERVMEIARSLYPKSRIRFVSGHHSQHKIIEVHQS